MAGMKVIAGLGNPGSNYAGTRHNAGFDLIDRMAERFCVEVNSKKFSSLIGECEYDGTKLMFVKPQLYMNCSGQSIATVMGFYKLEKSSLLVVTDDMALEPGVIRLRAKGSAGGHNGLSDIISKVGGQDFSRLRIGIGRNSLFDTKDYVLGRPSKDERELIDESVRLSVDAVMCWVCDGIERAMTRYNVKNKP